MDRNIREKDHLLRVTLEYVETPGGQTRLAQAFRLILIQLPALGPSHVTSDHQKDADAAMKDCEADL